MINKYLDESIEDIKALKKSIEGIEQIINKIKTAHTIFICGNGGSSSTASHFANDLQKMCDIKAICLNDNIPLITAWSNDEDYSSIFMRQLETLAVTGDTLIVFTGSGNSKNLINAINYANDIGMNTIAFVGGNGGKIFKDVSTTFTLCIPSDMQHAEDWQLILSHIIMRYINEYNMDR